MYSWNLAMYLTEDTLKEALRVSLLVIGLGKRIRSRRGHGPILPPVRVSLHVTAKVVGFEENSCLFLLDLVLTLVR